MNGGAGVGGLSHFCKRRGGGGGGESGYGGALLIVGLVERRERPAKRQGARPCPAPSPLSLSRPPLGHIGALQAVGCAQDRPYLADRGFNSARWQRHWQVNYGATVLSVPPHNDPHRADWSRQDCLWLASHRQIIDTTFGFLAEGFCLQFLQAPSRWGPYTRLAAQ